MTVSEINPYVRFARFVESRFFIEDRIPYDHRLFFVEKGKAVFYFADAVYELEAGDAIYWPAGTRYRVEPSTDTIVSGCNFDFFRRPDTELLPLYPARTVQFSGRVSEKPNFSDMPAFNGICCFRNTYGVLPKLHELYEEFDSRQLYFEQRCSALLKDALMLCLRFYNRDRSSGAARLTREILSYIRQNYSSDLSAEHFGEVFHYHPNYISQLIKDQTGLPLHQYIRTYRMYTALELLQASELSIGEIAEQVGMPDIHQFSKAFKQIIGTPPSSFRK